MANRGQAARRVDQPEPGFYEMRLVRGGPFVAAKITLENGLWGAWIDGVPCGDMHEDPAHAAGVFRIWHGADEITEAEYQYRVAVKTWAVQNNPQHPAAAPRTPINLAEMPPLRRARP